MNTRSQNQLISKPKFQDFVGWHMMNVSSPIADHAWISESSFKQGVYEIFWLIQLQVHIPSEQWLRLIGFKILAVFKNSPAVVAVVVGRQLAVFKNSPVVVVGRGLAEFKNSPVFEI